MDTETELLLSDHFEPARVRRRRRWVVGVLVLVVALVAPSVAYVANHQPIQPSGGIYHANACLRSLGSVATGPPRYTVNLFEVVCDRQGDIVQWGFTLENGGPFTLQGFRVVPSADLAPLFSNEVRSIEAERTQGMFDEDDAYPQMDQGPVTLAPGEARFFILRSRHTGCDEGNGGTSTLRFEIRLEYEIAGFERADVFYPPMQVRASCPAQQDLRS